MRTFREYHFLNWCNISGAVVNGESFSFSKLLGFERCLKLNLTASILGKEVELLVKKSSSACMVNEMV